MTSPRSEWTSPGRSSGIVFAYARSRDSVSALWLDAFCPVAQLAFFSRIGRGSVRKTLTLFGLGCGIGYACKRAVYDFEPYSPDVTLMKGRQLTPTSAPSGP